MSDTQIRNINFSDIKEKDTDNFKIIDSTYVFESVTFTNSVVLLDNDIKYIQGVSQLEIKVELFI